MSRPLRLVIEGMPHHVVQRGNYRQNVFENAADFQCYSYWSAKYAAEYNIDIIAYCLMTNHVHFVVVPKSKKEFSMFFKMTHMRYSQYKNKKASRNGHLWQGRFYSSILDEAHLLRAVRYVEQNPVRAKMGEKPHQYIWSSARFHLGLEREPIIRTVGHHFIRAQENWASYLVQEDELVHDKIRKNTSKGIPIATEEFISSIEQKFGITLTAKKRGRPSNKGSQIGV